MKNSINLGVLEKFSIIISFLLLSLVVTERIFAPILTLVLLFYIKLHSISCRSIFFFLRIPLIFAFTGLLSIVLVLNTNEPDKIWVISKQISLSITKNSLKSGEIVFWRALNSLLSLYILLATTTAKEKNKLADKLHIPYPIIELGILSFRYIKLLDKKRRDIIISQKLRLGYSSYIKSFRSFSLLTSTVFIYSIVSFRMNHQALLTRGYSGRIYYSSDDEIYKDRWWFIFIIFILLTTFLVCYQYFVKLRIKS